jgi:hypothetical protein
MLDLTSGNQLSDGALRGAVFRFCLDAFAAAAFLRD